jgi:hypothetical protein
MILTRFRVITLAFTLLMAIDQQPASADSESPSWDKWQPLIGTWKAEGKGNPGQGAGTFSFAFDLQNKVIVRKSHTDYPAAEGRPAFAHDDLMIIYADEASHRFRADYFDNEGHVIRYAAEFSPDGKTVTFLSDPMPSQPTFRLVYAIASPAALGIKFEIAPPNMPDKFKVYVEGEARK